MSVETWGLQPKSQTDPETIEQAIERIVAEHEHDPTSHLGENESIEAHRKSEVIDHLAESILNDKLYIASRAYTAIVGSDENDDYADLQSAIDYVHSVGGGSVYIKSGTYILGQIITLYENVKLVGQSRESVFLDCIIDETLSYGTAHFEPAWYNTGTITVTNGSKIVTGHGTAFLSQNLQAGDWISTDNYDVGEIATVDSDTQITLVSNYTDVTVTEGYNITKTTNLKYIVTGIGTHWLSDGIVAGNEIKLNSDGYYYTIASVDSDTQITLTDTYEDAGGTGAYTVKKIPYLSAGELLDYYNTGTITATKDSKTITGSGTLWSGNVVAGQTILINGVPYIINSVNSNTSITLVDYYRGKTTSSLIYFITSYIENISLQDFNLINCENRGAIQFRCVSNSIIENVEVHGCNYGISLYVCNNVTVQRCDSSRNMFTTGSIGFSIGMSTRCNILNNNFSGNRFHGFYTSAQNFYCNINGNTINNNGSNGIVFNAYGAGGIGNTMIGNTAMGNVVCGISIEKIDYLTLSDNLVSYNGSHGITIQTCHFGVFKGNQSFKNSGDGIFLHDNSYTSQVERSIIDSNICHSNTGNGIKISTGCLKNIVTSNIVYSNGTNISDSGTSTTLANNITS